MSTGAGDRFRAGKRLWNPEDDVALRVSYPDHPTQVIAGRLRRTTTAISARARMLGLKKSPAYLASPQACRLRRGDNVGAQFRFPKGHVPANKGLRRPGWSAGRMKTTQFQPGQRNGEAARHYMPIDSTRLVDGYLYRKIADVPNGTWTRNWTLEHRRIWTEAHGPVPRGHALVFRNGDRTDVRLANLECIPRRVLMARNSIHNLPPSLAHAIQLLAALNRQVHRKSGHADSQQD